jgi:hypothetical protein
VTSQFHRQVVWAGLGQFGRCFRVRDADICVDASFTYAHLLRIPISYTFITGLYRAKHVDSKSVRIFQEFKVVVAQTLVRDEGIRIKSLKIPETRRIPGFVAVLSLDKNPHLRNGIMRV